MLGTTESSRGVVTATRVSQPIALNARSPAPEWGLADPIRFSADWQGKNADIALETEVRVLWSQEMLYLRFVCRYRELFVLGDSDPNGRRDQLWERDVAEAFLQPPESRAKSGLVLSGQHARGSPSRYRAFYKEFEIAPNGLWLDLDISPEGSVALKGKLDRSVHLEESRKFWAAELAIPIVSLTSNFDSTMPWRVNFYRVEGKSEPRRYLAWQPTQTPEPDFHVPEVFGTLRFLT